MSDTKVVIQSKQPSSYQLPGVVVLPDAKKKVPMGSGTIVSLISSGGMSIIYEIWNDQLEVRRAVKLLHPDHSKESEERFQTEIKITAKLHHPNIVEIYAVGKWNDLPYIEMELIEGLTLENLIAETGGLPVEVCTSIGIMVGRALNYSHNQDYQIYGKEYRGIIHRDLKPGNIMVNNRGIVKLMDFGIAKPMTATTCTLEGVIMGTMQYLAPEQLDGKDVDVRVDLYSLGTVIYEMLTGAKAFPEQNLAKLVTDKLNNNYVPLDGFSRKIPPPLCNLVHKCLRYEKEKRVQNALEFLHILGNVHKSLSPKSPEQILSEFMKETHHSRTVVSIRKNIHVSFILHWGSIAGIVAAIIVAGIWAVMRFSDLVSNKPQTGAQDIKQTGTTVSTTTPKKAFRQPVEEKPIQRPAEEKIKAKEIERPLLKTVSAGSGKELKKKNKQTSIAAETGKKRHGNPSVPETQSKPVAINPPATALTQKNQSAETIMQKEQEIKPANKKQLLGQLKQSYKTSNTMVVFTSEVEAGHFQNALAVSEFLDKDDSESKKTKIFKLRALKGAGQQAAAAKLMLTNDLYDGEFYLEKGLYYFDQRDLAKAQELLRKAAVSPCGFLDAKAFRQTLLYSSALCASAIYDRKGSEEAKKSAMEAWYNVKSLLRNSQEHDYYKKADAEIRRISKPSSAVK